MSALDAVHPFLSHLVALLSIYELQPTNVADNQPSRTPGIPLPRYNGPRSATTDAIERSLDIITSRMKDAEDKLGLGHPWLYNGRHDNDQSTPTASTNGTSKYSGGSQQEINPFNMVIHAPAPSPTGSLLIKHPRAPSPMQISLQGINNTSIDHPHSVDRDFTRSPTSPHSPYPCPTCRRPLTKSGGSQTLPSLSHTSGVIPSPNGSPLVVPPGPLSAAAFESGLSAVEELRLLKAQVQDVARVCKAVADGDLTQKIEVGVQGPVMVQLKDVINSMVDKLGQFAKEVTRVSLEVGTEGRLGGQAVVVGVQGKWQELTDVVNRLAANLSTQVRSIAIVTTAVARGDLSQMIEVDAKGEILALKVRGFPNHICSY